MIEIRELVLRAHVNKSVKPAQKGRSEKSEQSLSGTLNKLLEKMKER